MVFRESSGYLRGLKFIECPKCKKKGIKWVYRGNIKFKQCRYCRFRYDENELS